jgi:hypothetical protein
MWCVVQTVVQTVVQGIQCHAVYTMVQGMVLPHGAYAICRALTSLVFLLTNEKRKSECDGPL